MSRGFRNVLLAAAATVAMALAALAPPVPAGAAAKPADRPPTVRLVAARSAGGGAALGLDVAYSCPKSVRLAIIQVVYYQTRRALPINSGAAQSGEGGPCDGAVHLQQLVTGIDFRLFNREAVFFVTLFLCESVDDFDCTKEIESSRVLRISPTAETLGGEPVVTVRGVKRVARGAAVRVKLSYNCSPEHQGDLGIEFRQVKKASKGFVQTGANAPDPLVCDNQKHRITLFIVPFTPDPPDKFNAPSPWRKGKAALSTFSQEGRRIVTVRVS